MTRSIVVCSIFGGAGRVAQDELRGRAVDPGDEHRPFEGEQAGQVEVVERVVRHRRSLATPAWLSWNISASIRSGRSMPALG